ICVVFVFQAEDGILDSSVTGVQTCALPISVAVDFHFFKPFYFRGLVENSPAEIKWFEEMEINCHGRRVTSPPLDSSAWVYSCGEIGRASCREERIAEGTRHL